MRTPSALPARRDQEERQGPTPTPAQLNRAAIEHARAGNLDAALRCFQLEHALVPDGRALADVAQTQAEQGNIEQAAENFYAAAKLLDTPQAWSQYLSWSLHSRYDEDGHRAWSDRFAGKAPFAAAQGRRREGRIRVGYLSASFCDCACGHFLRPVIENHDPQRVEVVCYSNSAHEDAWTIAFKTKASWRKVAGWPDANVVGQILDDEIDVLVDIEGHKRQGRPMVLAALSDPSCLSRRAGMPPCLLSYIGYAADTFLATNIDCLGWAWRPHDDPPPITSLPFDQNGYATFGHVGRACKITIPVALLWARVLCAVPTARLKVWCVGGEKNVGLRRRLVESAVPDDRLTLVDRRARLRDYLVDITEIDLSLDTFPFAGCATTCELLWQGVPTVTLAEAHGRAPIRRVPRMGTLTRSVGIAPYQKIAAMLARAADVPALIAGGEEQYVEKVVKLAAEPNTLRITRQTMRERLKSSPLLDGRAIAARLEDAYEVAARGLELSSC